MATISSIMTREVVTVDMDDSLETIREIFQNVKFHHILVTENQILYGVISDRDLLKTLSPFSGTFSEHDRDIAVLNRRAHQIMSREPITVSKKTGIKSAVSIMFKNNVSCLPVTSQKGEIEGIVTWKDLIMAYVKNSLTVNNARPKKTPDRL